MTLDTAFLGLIALATVVMAVIQVTLALMAARAAREAAASVQKLRTELGPIIDNARKASDDAVRITALALTQAQRVDEFVQTATVRIDETLVAVQDVVTGPLRQGAAVMDGLKAALAFFAARRGRERDRDRDDDSRDEDDDENLFIG